MENKKYIVYIDESNIVSNTGHSVYVALFVQLLNKESVDNRLLNIEKELNISYIHWVDMPWKLRLKFAKKIKDLDFVCKIVVYKNPVDQRYMLVDFLIKIINLKNNICEISIDGKKSKSFKLKLKAFLRKKGIKIYKLNFVNDRTKPLIRLADFMAGMYRSYIDNKNKENSYLFEILKHKIKIPN